jgi:hypothetical protein
MNILTCVPTGMKTGVSTSQCNKFITLDRALHTLHFAFIWKPSAALFPSAGIFNAFQTSNCHITTMPPLNTRALNKRDAYNESLRTITNYEPATPGPPGYHKTLSGAAWWV